MFRALTSASSLFRWAFRLFASQPTSPTTSSESQLSFANTNGVGPDAQGDRGPRTRAGLPNVGTSGEDDGLGVICYQQQHPSDRATDSRSTSNAGNLLSNVWSQESRVTSVQGSAVRSLWMCCSKPQFAIPSALLRVTCAPYIRQWKSRCSASTVRFLLLRLKQLPTACS